MSDHEEDPEFTAVPLMFLNPDVEEEVRKDPILMALWVMLNVPYTSVQEIKQPDFIMGVLVAEKMILQTALAVKEKVLAYLSQPPQSTKMREEILRMGFSTVDELIEQSLKVQSANDLVEDLKLRPRSSKVKDGVVKRQIVPAPRPTSQDKKKVVNIGINMFNMTPNKKKEIN